ncbi:MAG: glycoside hydrolase family 3 C-terminal domain-containing protein [Bifidobacteriaceae bacterium]|jgi:beta-glucosidase|nr:glycoside hydrolase family 3 C-terminal domain-containing protein [Bifidobacteriaceae bacterium]
MPDVPIEAKVALTGGADFWHSQAVEAIGLPQVMLTDGPHGVRKAAAHADGLSGIGQAVPATCFPPAVGLSATWDRDLVRQVGVALGEESVALGVGVLLGPGVNLKRSPLCGRNFEYFSEDPFITGELAAALVTGIQSEGVGASVKHFAANNQETDRMRRDSQIDQRTLRELYLRAFQKVVTEARPWTVMCSYNQVNGTHAAENHFLLTEVLRDEWGHDGLVVSDWGATHDRVAALKAGLDLEMPANPAHQAAVLKALANGDIDQATVEQAYGRVEKVLRRAADRLAASTGKFDAAAHHALARRAAAQAVVLLANDGVLPLAAGAKLAVVGEFARTPRYQGAGSSRVNPTRLDNALDAIRALAGQDAPFAAGFTTDPASPAGPDAHDQAVAIAEQAEVVLVFLGLGENQESEGYDRDTMDLPAEQLALLEDILAVNRNVVVIVSNGSSVLLPFASRVRAVVEGWLLGQAGGPALADVLFGLVNPSGKLTETIPKRAQDVPSYPHFPGDRSGVRYGEGLFVGYRGYDARQLEVAYPFGHGLSYTSFDYSDLAVAPTATGLRVELTVTNTGARAGREVVQVYVGLPASKVVRAPRELKGFASLTLEPGGSARTVIEIANQDLAHWSVLDQGWAVEGGDYLVEVGASSRDLRLSTTVTLAGDEPPRPLTLQSTLSEALAVPAFANLWEQMAGPALGGPVDAEVARMMADAPLSALVAFSGQPADQLQAAIDRINANLANGAKDCPRV